MLLIGIIILIHKIFNTESTEITSINDDFYYCPQVKTDLIMHVTDKCNLLAKTNNQYVMDIGSVSNYYNFVLTKLINGVNGIAYECFQEEFSLSSWKSFFGMEHSDVVKYTVRLTRIECELMIKSNKCGDKEMICNDNECFYQSVLKPQFTWLSQSVTKGRSCKLSKRKLLAKNADSLVYNNCQIKQLECRTKTGSLIIWYNDIIMKCPYTRLATIVNLTSADNDIYYDPKTRHVFKINNITHDCGMRLFHSEQGLLITNNHMAQYLNSSEIELSAVHQLMLSETDGEIFETEKEFAAIHKHMCHANYDRLHALSKSHNTYQLFEDHIGNRRIVYSWKGAIFLPKCIKIRSVNFTTRGLERTNAGNCGINPYVQFSIDSYSGGGYLRQDGIISNLNQYEICDVTKNLAIRYFTKNKKYLTIYSDSIIEMSNEIIIPEELHSNMKEINFPHYERILDEIDIYKEMKNAQTPRNDEMHMIENNELEEEKNTTFSVTEFVNNFKLIDYNKLQKRLLIALVVIIISIIIIKLIYTWLKRRITINNNSNINSKVMIIF